MLLWHTAFLFKRDMFIRVDETGANNHDHIRKYGCALCGMTPTFTWQLVHGKRINAIVGITSNGILVSEINQV